MSSYPVFLSVSDDMQVRKKLRNDKILITFRSMTQYNSQEEQIKTLMEKIVLFSIK